MTKPVTRKMAVDCLLHRIILQFGKPLIAVSTGEELLPGMAIEFDHVHADTHGGPHEYQNLRPLPSKTHRKKTAKDIAAKAKGDRLLGLTCTGPTKKIPSRGFDKTLTRKFSGETVKRAAIFSPSIRRE